MAKTNQAGFTLIELILVMAITASLSTIAFIGQRSLRSRAQFDAAINKVVASVSDARNEAISAVNLSGNGNGSAVTGGACTALNPAQGFAPGPAGGSYVYAGTEWDGDNSLASATSSVVKIQYFKAAADAGNACSFNTRPVDLSSPVNVNTTALPNHQGLKILFIRTNDGGLAVCPEDLTADSRSQYIGAACDPASVLPMPATLNFSDGDGHTAQVQIDATGTAKRLN